MPSDPNLVSLVSKWSKRHGKIGSVVFARIPAALRDCKAEGFLDQIWRKGGQASRAALFRVTVKQVSPRRAILGEALKSYPRNIPLHQRKKIESFIGF